MEFFEKWRKYSNDNSNTRLFKFIPSQFDHVDVSEKYIKDIVSIETRAEGELHFILDLIAKLLLHVQSNAINYLLFICDITIILISQKACHGSSCHSTYKDLILDQSCRPIKFIF